MSYTHLRVASRSVALTQPRNDFYDVQLVLTNRSVTPAGTGEGSTGGFPLPPPQPPPPTSFCCSTVTPGTATDIRTDPVFEALVPAATLGATVTIEIVEISISDTLPSSGWGTLELIYSWDGGTQGGTFVATEIQPGHPGAGSGTGQVCWNGGSISACTGTLAGSPPTFPVVLARPNPLFDETLRLWGIRGTNGTSAPTTFCLEFGTVTDDATSLVLSNEVDFSAPTPPAPGQWVGISPPEVVTMSGADGTTVWPFADGSLVVLHDGFDQSSHISSYDGAAGTFALDYTPGVGATITVRYQGR